ncbi:OR5R1 protein, partial [Eubucco bourcierii]|nr:OR5R1 protein [Eubucco bourcierii]
CRGTVPVAAGNHTSSAKFLLLGFLGQEQVQAALFLAACVVTLLGNVGMLLLVCRDAQLHTPMYFFPSSLSFLDLCYSSTITPRMLWDLLAARRVISYPECLAQFYFYAIFSSTECYLLAAMAYDCYMAICSPLLYTITMPSRVCLLLVGGSYLAGIFNATIHEALAWHLSFCGPNLVNHFYCKGSPLLAISCTDPTLNQLVMFVMVGLNLLLTSLTILLSYTCILAATLRMRQGAQSASNLAIVTLFYGSFAFRYLGASSRHSQDLEKMASEFYTLVTPTLNPVIYSLRNKEVKKVLGRAIERKCLAGK